MHHLPTFYRIMKKRSFSVIVLLSLLTVLNGCQFLEKYLPEPQTPQQPNAALLEVARSDKQWTGLTVTKQSRLFVNYPNWSPMHTISVAEVTDTAQVQPFPDGEWNTWNATLDPAEHFVCVQSVWADENNLLWVLDPANPQREGKYLGVVKGGAKLVAFDLTTGKEVKKYVFQEPVITPNSYLNDVRFDFTRQYAYMTDSNEGAIVVLNLATGESYRRLANHYSTKSENLVIKIDSIVWRNPDGTLPTVDSDGIALDRAGAYLYYQALTGKTLYRIGTQYLRDNALPEREREQKVEKVGQFSVADGIIFGPDNNLYLTDVPGKAIKQFQPLGGLARVLVQDPRLQWPAIRSQWDPMATCT